MSDPERRSIEISNLNKWRAIYRTLLTALVVIIIAAQSTAIAVIVVRQNSNTSKADDQLSILKGVKKTNAFIVDCTTPGRACYDQGQKNTAALVQKLDEIILLSNYCATVPANIGDFAKQRKCVEDGLK